MRIHVYEHVDNPILQRDWKVNECPWRVIFFLIFQDRMSLWHNYQDLFIDISWYCKTTSWFYCYMQRMSRQCIIPWHVIFSLIFQDCLPEWYNY